MKPELSALKPSVWNASSFFAETTSIEIGTLWMFSARFCAVTTTSSTAGAASAASTGPHAADASAATAVAVINF